MSTYARFVIRFFLLCTLGTPWANYCVTTPKKCGTAAMLLSGKNAE